METKTLKIYHVQGWEDYSNWIPNRKVVDKIEDADIVWFEGGDDVFPGVYNQAINPKTSYNLDRDIYEGDIYKQAQKLGKFCIGSCRGSQLLCSLQPHGMLVQHQENPSYMHTIETYDGQVLNVNSTHHQSQYPFNMNEEDYCILGWTNGRSKIHEGGLKEELNPPKECEIVYYPKTKCLAIQSHPEAFPSDYPSNIYLLNIIDKFLANTLEEDFKSKTLEHV